MTEQVILDGVCSVASEEIRFDDWGIDVVVGATQKGLGVPPGLSVVCASQKALKVGEVAAYTHPFDRELTKAAAM